MSAPQGSEAWRLDRCGRATASCFSDVLAKGQGTTRTKYLRRVLAERLTGQPIEGAAYGSWAQNLDRGNQQEQHARFAYQEQADVWPVQTGFIPHPEIMAGCSPDSLIADDGALEIKSVIPTVQIETLLRKGGYPPEHKAQVQGVLWITGRQWIDFVSWSPDMPEHLRLYVFRVERDEKYIETLAGEVVNFLAEVDELERRLMEKRTLTELLVASIEANHPASQP